VLRPRLAPIPFPGAARKELGIPECPGAFDLDLPPSKGHDAWGANLRVAGGGGWRCAIARHFLQADKPVATICHGPQLLIATGLMAARTATCYRAVRQELEAAGANYVDREVVVDGNLITSRQPGDIPAFTRAIFRITRLSR
jgi:DJ-1/PfpI family